MYLSAIAWSGLKKVYYLFYYEETRDIFGVAADPEGNADLAPGR